MRIVFGVDPGVETGVAQGLFSDGVLLGPMKDIWAGGKVGTYTGGPSRTAAEEADTAHGISFDIYCEWRLARGQHGPLEAVVAIEDFILRRLDSGRDLLAPVRITALLEARLEGMGVRVVKYPASAAKGLITDARLRHWGGWIKGRPHERDAARQLLMAVRQERARLRSTPGV